MGVARFSRPLIGVRVIAMLNAGLDTMQRAEVPQGAGVLCRLEAGETAAVFIDHRCVRDAVDVTP